LRSGHRNVENHLYNTLKQYTSHTLAARDFVLAVGSSTVYPFAAAAAPDIAPASREIEATEPERRIDNSDPPGS